MNGVVITGVGACTAEAANAASLWSAVSANTPPVRRQKEETPSRPQDQLAQALEFAHQTTDEALQSAGLLEEDRQLKISPDRLGLSFSASKPLFQGDDVLPPDVVGQSLSRRWGVEGESRNVIAACATGAYSVALGALWIEEGLCDVVLAGSVEPPAHPLIEAGFRQMGVVSPENTMRPFDRQRSGFVLAEGAGAIILESRRHARERGAAVLSTLSGWGWGADTHSAVTFNSNGERIAQVIRQALRRGGLAPESIRHVNAHGTATRSNDWIETQALIKAFGRSAVNLMISGTKSTTGHLLGAAGSVELVLTILALTHQFIPPTANLENPEAALDYTPRRGHAAAFEHALSLSFGFGGPIGALIVSRS